jgi:hypothetical protein
MLPEAHQIKHLLMRVLGSGVARSTHDPLDSRSLFSNSPAILDPFGARRLSQRSHPFFPKLRKGVYPRIYGRGGSLIHRSTWKVKSKKFITKILCRAGSTPISIQAIEVGRCYLGVHRKPRKLSPWSRSANIGQGMSHPHGTLRFRSTAAPIFEGRRHQHQTGSADRTLRLPRDVGGLPRRAARDVRGAVAQDRQEGLGDRERHLRSSR